VELPSAGTEGSPGPSPPADPSDGGSGLEIAVPALHPAVLPYRPPVDPAGAIAPGVALQAFYSVRSERPLMENRHGLKETVTSTSRRSKDSCSFTPRHAHGVSTHQGVPVVSPGGGPRQAGAEVISLARSSAIDGGVAHGAARPAGHHKWTRADAGAARSLAEHVEVLTRYGQPAAQERRGRVDRGSTRGRGLGADRSRSPATPRGWSDRRTCRART